MIAAKAPTVRGRPLVAMVAVLALWVSLRLMFWQSPLMLTSAQVEWAIPGAIAMRPRRLAATRRYALLEAHFRPLIRFDFGGAKEGRPGVSPQLPPVSLGYNSQQLLPLRRLLPEAVRMSAALSPDSQTVAAVSAGAMSAGAMADPVFSPAPVTRSRWTMSSWLFWRDSSADGGQAAMSPNYGRSQAGVVLAYQLAPDSAYGPQAYTRIANALEGPREGDLAVGLSARPLPNVPVRLAAEARLSLRDGASELRPAVFVVSEVTPFVLPAKMVGEAYAQAGWVGGEFATGFVDAQMRVTRAVAQTEDFVLSAGGGAWAGAQTGTRRLDVGPSVSASFRLSDEIYGRLSADYRVRVAGNAAPASGPALTLSAGF